MATQWLCMDCVGPPRIVGLRRILKQREWHDLVPTLVAEQLANRPPLRFGRYTANCVSLRAAVQLSVAARSVTTHRRTKAEQFE